MDQYLEKIEVFYDQKMKYLTKKDKFIKCQKCEGDKILKIDNKFKFHDKKN